jgi:hypothetical protein
MTTLLDGEISAPAEPAGRSRRFKLLAAVIALGAIGTGLGWLVQRSYYRPTLGPGDTWSYPYGAVRPLTDGITDPTAYIIVGQKGATGTLALSLRNDSKHTVTLAGLDDQALGYQPGDSYAPTARWTSEFHNRPDGVDQLGGGFNRSSAFPLTLTAGDEVSLFITVKKPACDAGTTAELDGLYFRADSLGHHHLVDLDLTDQGHDNGYAPIALCSPSAALKHIAKP